MQIHQFHYTTTLKTRTKTKCHCQSVFTSQKREDEATMEGIVLRWSLLVDLSLVELLASKVSLPGKVLLDQSLGLGCVRVQLPPGVGLVVNLPVLAQLQDI